jgi:MFS family permease
MRLLFRDRPYRLLWTAQTTSSFGDALTSLTLLLLAHRLTGSTAAVAGTAIAIALPQLLVGLMAGVMVDRWNRRRVMIVSDLVRAALVLGFIAVGSADELWLLYALAFTQAAVGTFFNPARATLLAEVLPVDRLLPANSLTEMSRVVAGVAGVAAAGALAGASESLSLVFVIDAVTFVISAALVARVAGSAQRAAQERKHVLRELTTGLALIRSNRVLLGVVTAGAVAMFGLGAVNVLLVPFVVDDLGASEAWFGALEAAIVAAMVASGALVAAAGNRVQPTYLVSGGAIGLGAAVAGLSLARAPAQMLPLLFAAGVCVTPLQAAVTTLLQTKVAPEVRARTQATFNTLVSGANLASMSLAGTAAAIGGIRSVLVGAGAVVAGAGLLAHAMFRRAWTSTPSALLEVR